MTTETRRKGKWLLMAATLIGCCLALLPLAQADGQSVLVIAQTGAAPSAPPPAKNYAFEVLIVLVVFGGALYAVCRSSRRS